MNFLLTDLTALGIFVLFSVVVLSFGKVFEEKRHVRNRCPVSYCGAHIAQSRNGSDDNSVYVISSNPPSYDELLADKPPDYNDVSYLPSYEQYQRLTGQRSSCELNLNDCTACGNADFVEVNESQVHDNSTFV